MTHAELAHLIERLGLSAGEFAFVTKAAVRDLASGEYIAWSLLERLVALGVLAEDLANDADDAQIHAILDRGRRP